MNHRLLLLFCLLWLAACTPAGESPTPLPTLTREPTTTATINRRLP
ncbi:MAG: hypothetical protein KDE29_08210 [Anaerolineales bacterium]|nr:hypothetical protein [Anaerolineales bacterium]